MTTTSRELAFKTLAHCEPSRIPWTLYLAAPLQKKLEQCWGPRDQWPCPPDDLIRILWELEASDITPTSFRDPFGGLWRRDTGGYVFVDPPLVEPDARLIPRIDLFPESDAQRILEARKRRPDAFIFYQFTVTFSERLWSLRGMDQALMDYLAEPAFVHEALDILLDMHLTALDKVLQLPVDGVTFCDDLGTQRGPMLSREVFLEFLKPRLAPQYAKVRDAGKVVGQHSCGDVTQFLGDLIDIGLQVLHPLQAEAMNIQQVKRKFGKHLTFRGGIGTQGAIVFGTPDEARAQVRESVRILAEGGGYFLETCKPLPEETPVENAMAVIDEMTRVMHYQFA